jgi:ABC-type branched-subunit amino acid transport system ATPase component/ABC-type branched-subunit amino acid transport system permease subunit
VATIGVTQVLLVAQALMPDIIGGGGFPIPVTWTYEINNLVLRGEHFALLMFAPVALALLVVFLRRSRYGLAIRSVADNREAAKLAGIDTERVGTIVWASAGALAAIAAILTLPLSGAQVGTTASATLGPALLLRALAAGLAGGLVSLPRTALAGIVIGVVEAVLYATYPSDLGLVDLVLFGAVLVLLLLRSRAERDDADTMAFGADPTPVPAALLRHPTYKFVQRVLMLAALVAAVAAPFIWTDSSDLFLLGRIPVFAIIGISIVILTGWAGQLSLGQMAFVGLGAMGSAALASRGVAWGASIGFVAAAGVIVALVVGAPALRLRGLFLTVTTLGLAVAASSYLLTIDLFSSGNENVAVLQPGKVGFIDANSYRTGYFICLVALVVVVLLARRIRSTGVGRRIIAVEGNDQSAAAMTLSPAAAKLTAFGLAGGLAALAGALLAGITRTFQTSLFSPDQSLQVLAMTVVGGIGSVFGAVAGALYLIGVPTIFGDSATARLATSGIGLLVLLRIEPGGLGAIGERLRLRFFARLVPEEELEVEVADDVDEVVEPRLVPAAARAEDDVEEHPPLDVIDVTVRLGGRNLIEDVNLTVGPGEIVGLIGANGAGKTTLMNAISGFMPATGKILLGGEDIGHLQPHHRARVGLGRGFQSARLYPRLTARECVQVALEARHPTELAPALLALPPAVRIERWSRAAADEMLYALGLDRFADTRVAGLSTGTRRILEFACLLATQPSVVLLDEPMAGIAQREIEAFVPMLREIAASLGASMLIIEHDLPLISEVSDRLYCMEAGLVIAHGTPAEVRNDPLVIASYLGTDERAVARSGSNGAPRKRREIKVEV